MARLIDADALMEKEERYELDRYINDERCYEMAVPSCVIIEAPTIDAVSVVRCKECRYNDMEICPMYRLVVAGVRKYDDFCSYGERREP